MGSVFSSARVCGLPDISVSHLYLKWAGLNWMAGTLLMVLKVNVPSILPLVFNSTDAEPSKLCLESLEAAAVFKQVPTSVLAPPIICTIPPAAFLPSTTLVNPPPIWKRLVPKPVKKVPAAARALPFLTSETPDISMSPVVFRLASRSILPCSVVTSLSCKLVFGSSRASLNALV